jgi:adenylate cyclase
VYVLQRMLPALLRYANAISRTDAWLAHFQSALTALADQPDTLELRAMLRTRVAACLNQNGDYDLARTMLNEILTEMRRVLPEEEVQFAELVLGNGYLAQGKLDEAQAIYGQLLEADEMQTAYAAQANLAIVETRLGQYERAALHLQANRARAHADQNLRDEAIAALNLATVFLWQRDMAQTERTLREAEVLFAETDYEIGKARVQANLGELMLELQRPDEAEPYLQRALRMTREIGNRSLICTVLGSLGQLALQRQQYAPASAYLDECLAVARAISSDDHLAVHLQTAADLALAQGNTDGARETLHAALCAARVAGAHRQKLKGLLRLARLDVCQNRTAQAQRTLAALHAEANLPKDLHAEVDALVRSLPVSATAVATLDALLSELLGSL